MSWIIKDKGFYKQLALIAIPVAMQNILSFSVNMMDTLMIGQLGDVSLAATSIANNLFFLFLGIVFGISGGANILAAQYWGKDDPATIRKIMSLTHKFILLSGALFTLLALFAPEFVMSIYTTDPAVIVLGAEYLKVIAYCYLFVGLGNSTLFIFRSVGSVKMTVGIYSASLITNVFFNWVFIFGNLGAPAMGVKGAALATVIARFQEILIIGFYTLCMDKKIRYKLKDLFSLDFTLLRDFARTASIVVFNEMIWSCGSSVISIIVGRLSTDFVAAMSIASVVSQLVSVAIFGVSSAAAAMVGNTIGRGEYDQVKQMAKTLMLMGVLVGACASILTLIVRPIALAFYGNLSEVTRGYAYEIMGLNAFIVIFQAIASVNMMGTLRGGGDAKFVLLNDVVFMWLLAIPLGFFSAFVLHWSIPMVFLAIRCDEFFKTIICMWRINSGSWIHDVTR